MKIISNCLLASAQHVGNRVGLNETKPSISMLRSQLESSSNFVMNDGQGAVVFPRCAKAAMLRALRKTDLHEGMSGHVVSWNGCGNRRNAGGSGRCEGKTDIRRIERARAVSHAPSWLG